MKPLFPLAMSFIVALSMAAHGATGVDLGTAGNFAVLAKSGISSTAGTLIIGDIGVSPIGSTAITGFGLVLDPSGEFATSSLVSGQVYASDYASPTPSLLSVAVSDMEAAYTDAAGRLGPDFTNLSGGLLNGETLAPGLYKWTSNVSITDSITLDGGGDPDSVWILQVDQRLFLENGGNIVLTGGAQAQNIFWQTAGGATFETDSHFEGILLTATDIAVQTDASINGNLYAQTAITLDRNSIAQAVPEPSTLVLLTGGVMALGAVRRRRSA